MRFLTLIDRAWLVQPEGRAAEKVTQSRGDDEVSRFDRLPAAREAHYTGINKKNRDVTSYGFGLGGAVGQRRARGCGYRPISCFVATLGDFLHTLAYLCH